MSEKGVGILVVVAIVCGLAGCHQVFDLGRYGTAMFCFAIAAIVTTVAVFEAA